MKGNKANTAPDMERHTRFKSPYDNLLYAVLLRAAMDGDVKYLRDGDGAIIWRYLKTREQNPKYCNKVLRLYSKDVVRSVKTK